MSDELRDRCIAIIGDWVLSDDPVDDAIGLFARLGAEIGRTHAVVPKEPTVAMLNALFVLPDTDGHGNIIRYSIDKLPAAYRAMLAAAPGAGE